MNKSLILTPKQTEAYSLLASGKNVFVTGPAGTGKSEVIRLFERIYNTDRVIVKTATTGIAAVLLGGQTLHSYLGIYLGTDTVKDLVESIRRRPTVLRHWVYLDCLIIDEISMLDPVLFDKLEEVARLIRSSNKPFGGIQLVISGDFLQLPCVNSKKFCYEADSWSKCIDHTVYLEKIIRQYDLTFQQCLNSIRLGIITDEIKDTLNSRLKADISNDSGIKPTRLFCKNVDVDMVNEEELDKLSNDGRQFYEYKIRFDTSMSNLRPQQIKTAIDNYKRNMQTPEIIQLCIGAQVMLTYNFDVLRGLANGSRGIITSFMSDMPVVTFINGEVEIMSYTPTKFGFDEDKGCIFVSQIPIKLAYALTVHKSQGCTLDCAEINLSNIFEYGQAYVALSRVKNLNSLSIVDIDYSVIQAHPKALMYYKSLKTDDKIDDKTNKTNDKSDKVPENSQ